MAHGILIYKHELDPALLIYSQKTLHTGKINDPAHLGWIVSLHNLHATFKGSSFHNTDPMESWVPQREGVNHYGEKHATQRHIYLLNHFAVFGKNLE